MTAARETTQVMRNAAEVAIWCEQLQAYAKGKRVVGAEFSAACAAHLPPHADALLSGSRVTAVRRVASCLLLDMDTRLSLVVQLAWGGTVRWLRSPQTDSVLHDIALRFEHGPRLVVAVSAPEAAGLAPTANLHRLPLLQGLGPDVLSAEFTMDVLRATLGRTSRRVVRSVLLDQRRIAGLDGPVADEILLHARLHPRLPAHRLTLPQQRALFEAIRVVLRRVVEEGGVATNGFVDLHGKRGGFRPVGWDPRHRTCWRCGTPLATTRCGREQCFFCPTCQAPPVVTRSSSGRPGRRRRSG